MNRKRWQHELDLAAVELERHGMRKLADKVDMYSARLMKARTDREIRLIARMLDRIDKEANRHLGVDEDGEREQRIARLKARIRARKARGSREDRMRRAKANIRRRRAKLERGDDLPRRTRRTSGTRRDPERRSSLRSARLRRLRSNRY